MYCSTQTSSRKPCFARVKSPAEFVAGTARLAGGHDFPSPDDVRLAHVTDYMGQSLLDPPSVEGWHTGREWINTAGLVQRINFAVNEFSDAGRVGVRSIIDGVKARGPDLSPEAMVDACLDQLGPMNVSDETRKELMSQAASSGNGKRGWSAGGKNPGDASAGSFHPRVPVCLTPGASRQDLFTRSATSDVGLVSAAGPHSSGDPRVHQPPTRGSGGMHTQTSFTYSHTVGFYSNQGRGFNSPYDLALAPNGVMYVIKPGRSQRGVPRLFYKRITMCTVDEEWIGEFSRGGRGDGELLWPASIALDGDGNVFVADEALQRISIFGRKRKLS